MKELPKTYDAAEAEARWYARWLEEGRFRADPAAGGEPYCIVIPPPNVTGILHMGHALNNVVQDVLVRWKRAQGRNAVWVPGTDHAGIATQNVVEKALRKEGKTRQDLGREAFVARVWDWRAHYGSTIVGQLKKLGASCDWARERFTMDEGLSRAVQEVFIRLFEKGLVYRGEYIIHWCPRCGTALSDEESEHKPTRGKLWHIRYPLGDAPGTHVVVATTRPETLLGDTAVAVNPKDERYAGLVGRTLRLPVLGRELPVIADDFVDPAFGTGAVKVTPAHDPNDFAMGQRHGLPLLNVMNDDATMNEAAGPYRGLDRFECRKRIVRDLEHAGLLARVEDHEHAVGHCYRCEKMVEPRLSKQWFVRMKPLAAPAIEAVRRGEVRFTPERWTKVYLDWMENIRDWCISRQIWWGHRIPVFYCDACGRTWAARGTPTACTACASPRIRQDEDVLDTWFSSWLWPFSVFGWPERGADLAFYYPTHALVTASEILFFWVARMIVSGLEFMGRPPFRDVYIHGTVRDDTGRKMSKSLGNSIDPLEIIREFSADALRASLVMLTATGQDVYVSREKFEVGRNFATKIWNAARFLQRHTTGAPPPDFADPALDPAALSPDDQHLLARLDETIAAAGDALEKFRFNDYALAAYDFVWHQYCDWYLEYAKGVLYGEDGPRRRQVLALSHHAFSTALRLLQPLMPFLAEELWHAMGYGAGDETVQRARWPVPRGAEALARAGVSADLVAYVEAKHDFVRVVRTLRADYEIPPRDAVDFAVRPASAADAARLEADRASVCALARIGTLTIDPAFAPAEAMPGELSRLGAVYMSIRGIVDVAAEKQKLAAQRAKVDADLERVGRTLANAQFASKAPREVVAQQEELRASLGQKRARLQHLMDMLG